MVDTLEIAAYDFNEAGRNIKIGLEAFNAKKTELLQLKEMASGLKITSVDDKETIKKVETIRKSLKAERVQIEKDGKAMRETLTKINKHIIQKEDELVELIEPTEKELRKQEQWVEDEKDRIKQEEVAKENARVQARIDSLAAYGYAIDFTDIKNMSDETFTQYLSGAKEMHEKEVSEKVEADRLKKEQEEKEKAEREAENQRLETQKLEQDKERKELEEAKAKLAEQQAVIETERKKIDNEKLAIEQAKQKEEEDKKHAEELKAAEEAAAEKAKLKAIQDAKDAEEKRIADEARAKELAERKAARQPDKVKIQKYISDIKAVSVPELKTEDAKGVMAKIQELISRFDTFATQQAEAL